MEKKEHWILRTVKSPAWDVFPLVAFVASYATQEAVDDWAAGIALVVWLFTIMIRNAMK